MTEKLGSLRGVKKKLTEISEKLDLLLSLQRPQIPKQELVPDTIASLPEHLRKTALTIATMGQATAEQVAAQTGRTRAAESDYLNQLTSRGFLKRERRGKEVYFLVFSLYTICPQCGARILMTSEYCSMCGASLMRKQ